MELESDSESELDDTWIVDFEHKDKLYQEYYLDSVHYVCVYYIYVNPDNCIEKIKEEMFIMSKLGCILRNELIELIKKNCMLHNNKYLLLSLLKYNITIDPMEVKQCSQTNIKNSYELLDFGNKYLTVLRQIDSVFFQNTIHMFQDLNSLIVIFYNAKDTNNNDNDNNNYDIDTKQKQNHGNHNNMTKNAHTTTKKIRFDSIMKMHSQYNKNNKNTITKKTKTIRKQYKD